MGKLKDERIIESVRKILEEESKAINTLAKELDSSTAEAVKTILHCKGQIILTGLGKSGLIARKIAATLTSTGTPSVFVHPVDALHGDIGIVSPKDILIAFSKSGHSQEVIKVAQNFKKLGGKVISITEKPTSELGKISDIVIKLPSINEADPFDLAPTTSTTMMIALGDAIAITLLSLRGFTAEDFARFHPDGTLGRRLLLRAADIMYSGEKLPKVEENRPMKDVIYEITSKGLGITCVVDKEGRFIGTITDGDLRRLIERTKDPLKLNARQALELTRRKNLPQGPFTVSKETPAIECRQIMQENKITSLIVLNKSSEPIGIVRLQEITAAGL